MHAKVVVADDVVSFGTVNLDAWALYRGAEIMMIARSADAAERFEERLFEPDIARSKRGERPPGRGNGSRLALGQARVLPLTRAGALPPRVSERCAAAALALPV